MCLHKKLSNSTAAPASPRRIPPQQQHEQRQRQPQVPARPEPLPPPQQPRLNGFHIDHSSSPFPAPTLASTLPVLPPPSFRPPHRRSHSASSSNPNQDLSDILDINFNEIFASPELLAPPQSRYKGINLPKKKKGRSSWRKLMPCTTSTTRFEFFLNCLVGPSFPD